VTNINFFISDHHMYIFVYQCSKYVFAIKLVVFHAVVSPAIFTKPPPFIPPLFNNISTWPKMLILSDKLMKLKQIILALIHSSIKSFIICFNVIILLSFNHAFLNYSEALLILISDFTVYISIHKKWELSCLGTFNICKSLVLDLFLFILVNSFEHVILRYLPILMVVYLFELTETSAVATRSEQRIIIHIFNL